MPHFLLTWLLTAASLLITAKFVPGFRFDNYVAALPAAVVLGLVNAIIKPILVVLTLPITFITFGLFLFVVNAITIWFAGTITPGFHVAGFIPALIGSIVLTVVASVLNFVLGGLSR
jgi:putative membrane protein